jgi:hypothetical protein
MTKWYADCVDPGGRAAIAYWASLAIGSVAFTWHSVAVYEPGAPPFERTSLAEVPPPVEAGDRISWQAPALDCELTTGSALPAPALRLLDAPPDAIDWRCIAPSARSVIRVGGYAPIAGGGYVERLVTTVAPWRLPFDELRWGRWIAHDRTHSVAWIDWRGGQPHTWMLVDGTPRAGATVGDAHMEVDGASLALQAPRVLHARSLDDITRSIGPLAGLVPDSLRMLRETKWCSRGDWCVGGQAPTAGWAIHETVTIR